MKPTEIPAEPFAELLNAILALANTDKDHERHRIERIALEADNDGGYDAYEGMINEDIERQTREAE